MWRGADDTPIRWDVRKIGSRSPGPDAGQRPRLVGVDRHDPGVGMRAALDLAPQHARHFHVGAKIGAAGDLVDTVRADRTGADDLQIFLIEKTHCAASARITAAASSTARMILS